jgi:predicted nuclease of predicted toxin-antitoxin system
MRLLLDESAEYRLAAWLTAQGHNVTAIAREHPASLPDEQVLTIAHQEGRILITNDTDFGELIVRHGHPHAGVILFRMPGATAALKLKRLETVFTEHADALDQLLIVTERSVRIRRNHQPGEQAA